MQWRTHRCEYSRFSHHQLFIDKPDCELDITIVVIFTTVLGPPVHSHKEGKSSLEVESASKSRQADSIDVDIIEMILILLLLIL